jgi:acyl-coenzyme A synthetase/AMP-(fatty) acid ligase
MNIAQPSPPVHALLAAVPREYNFAADILKRNLDAGRAGKFAFIDQRQGWTYGDLAERVERFGHVLRAPPRGARARVPP